MLWFFVCLFDCLFVLAFFSLLLAFWTHSIGSGLGCQRPILLRYFFLYMYICTSRLGISGTQHRIQAIMNLKQCKITQEEFSSPKECKLSALYEGENQKDMPREQKLRSPELCCFLPKPAQNRGLDKKPKEVLCFWPPKKGLVSCSVLGEA